MYEKYVKRALDIILSFFLIILLSPLLVITAVVVRIKMGSPVLYSQLRIGKNEQIFRLYKFRSMTNQTDKNGNLLEEARRLTKFGSHIRSLSIDELPELFSILVGKMSFVGPRPLPDYYKPYFYEKERTRHTVRGGLIPPDSLSGKAYTTWEEQFEYEVNYAKHVSFLLDVKVVLMTFKILVGRFKTGYGADFDRPHLNKYRQNKFTSME